MFRFHRLAFYSLSTSKLDNVLTKTTSLWINLRLDGTSITSRSHIHPSHYTHTLKPLASYPRPSPQVSPRHTVRGVGGLGIRMLTLDTETSLHLIGGLDRVVTTVIMRSGWPYDTVSRFKTRHHHDWQGSRHIDTLTYFIGEFLFGRILIDLVWTICDRPNCIGWSY